MGLGSISTANATMVRDDYTVGISNTGMANPYGFTTNQRFNFSVTYNNAEFTTETTESSTRKNFLNPIFDLGDLAFLFPASVSSSSYSFFSNNEFDVITEGFQYKASNANTFLEGNTAGFTFFRNINAGLHFTFSSYGLPTQTDLTPISEPLPPISEPLPPIIPTPLLPPTITSTEVPEPETLAMMLLGLPMMAWTVRRRKKV
ncbi:MAG: PEP-CTERM sorting domain-containing protein [Methylococcaceae bacterium]